MVINPLSIINREEDNGFDGGGQQQAPLGAVVQRDACLFFPFRGNLNSCAGEDNAADRRACLIHLADRL